MKKGWLILLVVLFASFVSAAEDDCIYYFYGQGCPHCGATAIYLDELQDKYPGLQIYKFEIYYNKTNLGKLQEYFTAYEVPQNRQGVPAAFLSKSYFVGDRPIMEYLESAVLSNDDPSCPVLSDDGSIGLIGEKSPQHLIETLTFFTVTGAAIVDSINPCAIAVLLILIGALLSMEKRKRMLKTGLAFIASVYISYLLFGLGILSALSFTGMSYYFYKVIGVVAVLLGLLNIKDYFWYGKFVLMEIPLKWRPKMKKMLQSATSPLGAFVMGFAVSLFELPCTGGPYLVILGLLAEKATRWAVMPLLVYYNLIFILPLVIITFVIYFSIKKIQMHGDENIDIHGEIESWRQRNLKLLHLIGGLIMVVLGVVILVWL